MEREYVGICSVDSGTLLLIDPCYIIAPQGFEENSTCRVCGNHSEDDKVYMEVTEPVMGGKGAAPTFNNLGVITKPGFGDGAYPVYVELIDAGSWGKRVARIVIECIDPNEEEEYAKI